mmetsp:Transcript_7170/g.5440  ORF Transcript_7170/g.5440 Transcript_7170/m.5440 type:complete len:85 (+) Transcript_7170:815-1069(+)
MKEKVAEKKFSDIEFVGKQLEVIKTILGHWDEAKNDFDRVKQVLKNLREQYQDLHLEEIAQNLEARLESADREQQKLQKMFLKD